MNDPVDLMPHKPHAELDAFFRPRSIALVGASETPNSIGRAILENLTRDYQGIVYPVNPNRHEVLGLRTYEAVGAIEESPDLVLIAAPAENVPGAAYASVKAGAKGILIVTAGLDAEAKRDIQRVTVGTPTRVVGPNALGVINPALGLNATFAKAIPRAGRVTFLSQSGTLGAAVLSKSASQNVGIRAFLSVGDMIDVGWGELLTYFGADGKTRCIIVYMEALGDARAFLSAARETSLDKPIIVIKAGRTAEGVSALGGDRAVGADAVLDAAFRRCGVLRVDSIVDAFYLAQVLDKQPLPHGKKLTVITNARGPGVLAADALTETGGTLTNLFPKDLSALEEVLPRYWSRSNPIVVGSDAGADRYAAAFDIVMRRMATDGVLVILTPQAMSQPLETAKRLIPFAGIGKTVLACWMGGDEIDKAVEALNEAGIPTFAYPDTAARVFDYLWQYADRLTALYQTPIPAMKAVTHIAAEEIAQTVFSEARADRRPVLWPSETADVLRAYGLATSVDDVAPVVEDNAFHFRLVSTIDGLFGPVIGLRLSGRIAHKEGVGLPPLNSTLASMIIDAAGLSRALPEPVSAALNTVLIRFSQLVADHASIKQIVSEVIVEDDGEALVTRAEVQIYENEAERPRLAIRPYPTDYASQVTLKDGSEVILRPIRPEDEPYLAEFQRILSERSVQMRYFSAIELYRRTSHEWLSRQSFIDYEREIRLAAAPVNDPERIVATGQLIKVGNGHMEYAIMVSDEMQGKGLGTLMLTRLIEIGRQEGATAIIAYILYTNKAMLAVSRKLGFEIRRTEDSTIAQAYLPLG